MQLLPLRQSLSCNAVHPVLFRSTLDGIRGTARRTPQYTAASYTVLLNLGMVSIERFPCGHSDATKQDFSQNFFFTLYFRKKHC